MYGKIISFLFVLLVLYYVAMIFLDLQKLKAAKVAEKEKNVEEDIDISDEASTFKPVLITRDLPQNEPEPIKTESNDNENQTGGKNANSESTEKKNEPETPVPEEKQAADNKIPGVQEPPASGDNHNPSPNNPANIPSAENSDMTARQENGTQPKPEDKPYHRPGYRLSTMTDGVEAEHIIRYVDELAETGTGPLGGVIYSCQNA